MPPPLLLLTALALIAAWILFTFVLPAGLGIVHLLLALGVALVIRWWVVREPNA